MPRPSTAGPVVQTHADGRCTLKKFGTFSTPSYGGVGEPFDDSFQRQDRDTGTQMFTNRPKSGQTGCNWNRGRYGKREPVKPLFEGIKFVEEQKLNARQNMEERKVDLTTNGFKSAGKPKASTGSGAYWGCIGPKHAHMPDGTINGAPIVKKGEKPGPVEHETKQMMTMPSKKGYGRTTPGCIFGPGPLQGESGLGRYGGREYLWEKDPYELMQQKANEMHKEGMEAMLGRPPLVSMSHALDFIDGKRRVAAPEILTENPRLPERAPKPEPPPISTQPFFPAKAPKSGPQATFNKFPVYMADPAHLKLKAAQEEMAKNPVMGAPFKPTGPSGAACTPSIAFHVPGSNV